LHSIYLIFLPIFLSLLILLVSKKSFFSLLVGFLSACLIYSSFDLAKFVGIVLHSIRIIFYNDGLKFWNIAVLIFLPILATLSCLMEESGGVAAFSKWLKTKLKTKKQAEVLVVILGIIIYLDGYFSAIIVGSVGSSFSSSYKISKAKIAYYVDSTSAPICPMIPISSWGASILGILASLVASSTLIHASPSEIFISLIPYEFFTFVVLAMLFVVALGGLNIAKMNDIESKYELNKKDESESINKVHKLKNSGHISFITGILLLIFVTLILVVIEGYHNSHSFNILKIISSSNLALDMVYGSLISLIIYFLLVRKDINAKSLAKLLKINYIFTFKTIIILLLAWSMINAILALGIDKEIITLLKTYHISSSFLPLALFLIAMFLSFVSGTSWGTFYLLIPIAFVLGSAYGLHEVVVFVAAAITGSVFGDNCSLISDTTIISASASNCTLEAHYSSQIPYALVCGLIACLMWFVYGLSNSLGLAYLFLVLGLVVFYFFAKKRCLKNKNKGDIKALGAN